MRHVVVCDVQVRKKPKEWIPDAVWLNIVALSNMDAFRDIPDSVFRNDGLWRQWYDQEAPEMAKVRCCDYCIIAVWLWGPLPTVGMSLVQDRSICTVMWLP